MKNVNFTLIFFVLFFNSYANASSICYIEDVLAGIRNTHEIYIQGDEGFAAYFTEYETIYAPADTLFYLFDSTYHLVSWDDDSGGNFTSKIYEESLKEGLYYLVVSHYNFWPIDEKGVMFKLPSYVADEWEFDYFYQQYPVSDLQGPLVGWVFLGHGECGVKSYKLALEGASQVPEPTSIMLFTTGVCIFSFKARGKRSSVIKNKIIV